MQKNEIILKPAVVFAFLKTLPLIGLSLIFLSLAWSLSPVFLFFSISLIGMAWYRFIFIRTCLYVLTTEVIRVRRGIFFKRTDQVELYRLKDYIVTQPFLLQLFGLIDLTLKGTDPENPVLWLRGIPESDIVDKIRDRVQDARGHNSIYEIN